MRNDSQQKLTRRDLFAAAAAAPLAGAIAALYPQKSELTLRQAWEHYHRSYEHSTAYIQDVDISLKHWERIIGNVPVAAINNFTLRQFKEHFLGNPIPGRKDGRHYQATTFNKHLRNIEAILSAIGPKDRNNPYAHGILDEIPRVKFADEDDADPVIASLEEVSAIYEACNFATWPRADVLGYAPCDYWRALIVFLFNVGCRKSEFKLLTQEDCNLEKGLVLVRQPKTKKKRTLPINAIVVTHLRKIWLPRRGFVWHTCNNDRLLYEQWEKIQLHADIHVPRPEGSVRKNVYGFHELRKTCATELYALNPGVAQEFCGHSSVETTRKSYVAPGGFMRKFSEQRQQPEAFLRTG